MQLHFLGTTGYHPNARRHTACFMLPEQGIVLDAGTGMFRVRDRICTTELDIFLTHAHLDHIAGLTFLFDVLHEKQVNRVTVHGERQKLAAIEEHLLAELIFPVKPPCDFEPFVEPLAGRSQFQMADRSRTFRSSIPAGRLAIGSIGRVTAWPT